MISQLEVFCERAGKRGEIPYVEAFMLLHQEEKESEGCSPPHAANIFTPFTTSCFPFPWGSNRSFYVNPGAQGPGLVLPSKTQQGTQFGPGVTSAAGQFPLHWYPVRGQGTPLDLRRQILISPQEPWVTLTMGNKLTDFLVDTGATYSVVNAKVAQKTSQSILLMGGSGEVQNPSFLQPLEDQLGDLTLKHSFLYMPEHPIPLFWDKISFVN